jgi:hypothetical protein
MVGIKKSSNQQSVVRHIVLGTLCLCCLLTTGFSTAQAADKDAQTTPTEGQKAALTESDCSKCHTEAPQDIAEKGGAHKTSVTCMDCHAGHPPNVMEIIPQCSQCHSGKSHYELEGCLQCHSNPHAPLELSLAKNLTAPCLTCHEPQKVQLNQFKSFHSTMDCTACHSKHGAVPECMSCHQGHSPAMVQADCKNCHKAHMPLAVTFSKDLESKQCQGCHNQAFDLLMANKTKHRDLSCVTCHQDKHKMIPRCEDCHGVPHAPGIIAKFPECGGCHNIAHDLNNITDHGAKAAKPEMKGAKPQIKATQPAVKK